MPGGALRRANADVVLHCPCLISRVDTRGGFSLLQPDSLSRMRWYIESISRQCANGFSCDFNDFFSPLFGNANFYNHHLSLRTGVSENFPNLAHSQIRVDYKTYPIGPCCTLISDFVDIVCFMNWLSEGVIWRKTTSSSGDHMPILPYLYTVWICG